MANRTFETSWGQMEIEGSWVRGFLVGSEVKAEIELVMKFLMNNTKIAPRHKAYFSTKTEQVRGRWIGSIVWDQKDVYFKELHYHYLARMANKKYRTEEQLEAMRAKRRATYAARRRSA